MTQIPFQITDRALAEIVEIFEHKNIPPSYGLRIGIRGGGCGAGGFFVGFDQLQEGDLQWQLGTVKVLVEKRQLLYVMDLTLDFEERHDERGFVFHSSLNRQKNWI